MVSTDLVFHELIDSFINIPADFLLQLIQPIPVLAPFDLRVVILILLKLILHEHFFLLLANRILFFVLIAHFFESLSKIKMELADFFQVAADLPHSFLDAFLLEEEVGDAGDGWVRGGVQSLDW